MEAVRDDGKVPGKNTLRSPPRSPELQHQHKKLSFFSPATPLDLSTSPGPSPLKKTKMSASSVEVDVAE
jgi:hypothetical protein